MKMKIKAKTVQLRKNILYPSLIGTLVLAPLMGDSLKTMIRTPAAPVQAPVVSIDPDSWKSLASGVRRQADKYAGDAAYIIKDLNSGQLVESRPGRVFPSASLIKLPIMCAAFQAVEEGRLGLSAPVTLQREDRRGGSGKLKFASAGTVFTNRELLEAMIVHSDNTATELIVRQLGISYLQQTFAKLGLQDTQIHADGFRLSSRPVEEDNLTSPRDMAFLLEKIYRRELVTAEASDQMLEILKHQHLRDRLPRFLPNGWQIAHKTGLLRKACHDVGIVFTPKGDYMICVLTNHDRTYKTAKHFIASMGRITFDHYQGNVHRPVLQTRVTPATNSRTS